MSQKSISDEAKAIVRRNTEEVQGKGRFEVFEELFADDFVDHTTQPGTTPDKAGVRQLYTYMRLAFPDFHAENPLAACRRRPCDDGTKLTMGLTRARLLELLRLIARFISNRLM